MNVLARPVVTTPSVLDVPFHQVSSQVLTATGGGNISWGLIGARPSWVDLDANTGRLTFTSPSTPGRFYINVEARSSAGVSDLHRIALVVAGAASPIVNPPGANLTAVVGQQMTPVIIDARGNDYLVWLDFRSFVATCFCNQLSCNVGASGDFLATNGLTNPNGDTIQGINFIPTFTLGNQAVTISGTPYAHWVRGGRIDVVAELTWMAPNQVPGATGQTEGPPFAPLVMRNNAAPVIVTFSLEIGARPGIYTGTSNIFIDGNVGRPLVNIGAPTTDAALGYRLDIHGSGDVEVEMTGGTLPPGVEFNPVTRSFIGTPTHGGNFSVNLRATNEFGTIHETIVLRIHMPDNGYPILTRTGLGAGLNPHHRSTELPFGRVNEQFLETTYLRQDGTNPQVWPTNQGFEIDDPVRIIARNRSGYGQAEMQILWDRTNLPPGLYFEENAGLLENGDVFGVFHGVPRRSSANEDFYITIAATNPITAPFAPMSWTNPVDPPPAYVHTFPIIIRETPRITTTRVDNIMAGVEMTPFQFEASGTPYRWFIGIRSATSPFTDRQISFAPASLPSDTDDITWFYTGASGANSLASLEFFSGLEFCERSGRLTGTLGGNVSNGSLSLADLLPDAHRNSRGNYVFPFYVSVRCSNDTSATSNLNEAGGPRSDRRAFTIEVYSPRGRVITTDVGIEYGVYSSNHYQLRAEGLAPFTWSVWTANQAQWPWPGDDLRLDPITGVIYGISNRIGTYTTRIAARNEFSEYQTGWSDNDFAVVRLHVQRRPVIITPSDGIETLWLDRIIPHPHTTNIHGALIPDVNHTRVRLQGMGAQPYLHGMEFTAAGLPEGVYIHPAHGYFHGTPRRAGTFPVTVTARNHVGYDIRTFNLVVEEINPRIVTPAGELTATAIPGRAFNYQLQADGAPHDELRWNFASAPHSNIGLGGVSIPGATTLILHADGRITGSLPATGNTTLPESISFTVIVRTDEPNQANRMLSAPRTFVIQIEHPPVIVIPTPTPEGFAHVEIEPFIIPIRGVNVSISSVINLPPGLTYTRVDEGLRIAGTPTVVRNTPIILMVSNNAGFAIENIPVIIRQLPAPTVTSYHLGFVEPGQALAPITLHANCQADSTLTWEYRTTVINHRIPANVTISPSGIITGTPPEGGLFEFQVRARNITGWSSWQTVRLVVSARPEIAPVAPITIYIGGTQSTTVRVFAEDFGQTITWSATAGGIGVTINSTTGILTIPNRPTPGLFTINVSATNASGTSMIPVVIEFVRPSVPVLTRAMEGTVGQDFDYFVATGGHPFTFTIIEGTWPRGLHFNSHTGQLVGRPEVAGNFRMSIMVFNNQGFDIYTDIRIVIHPPVGVGPGLVAPVVETQIVPIVFGERFEIRMIITNNMPVDSWSLSASTTLPSGVYFDENTGTISGTLYAWPDANLRAIGLGVQAANEMGISLAGAIVLI
jgi:hypothetical protein